MTFLVLAQRYEHGARYLADRGFRCGKGSIWRRKRGEDRAFVLAQPEDMRGWDPEDTRVVRIDGWTRRPGLTEWTQALLFQRYQDAPEIPE